MKKRRNVLIAFVIAALLCLGVGYAALTDSITLNATAGGNGGTAQVTNPELFDIKWVAKAEPVIVKGDEESPVSARASFLESEAMLVITNMCVEGDTVTAEFTVENTEIEGNAFDAEVTIQANVTTSSHDQFTGLSYGFVDAEGNFDDQTTTIANGATAVVRVVISLETSLIDASDVFEYVVDFTLSAEAK